MTITNANVKTLADAELARFLHNQEGLAENELQVLETEARRREVVRERNPAPAIIHAAITGVDIPFGDLVMFIIKFTLASIPAMLILGVLFFVVSAILTGVIHGVK